MANDKAVYDRITACRALGKKYGCSRVLITDSIDVAYLTGFHSSSAYCCVGPAAVTIVTDFRYQESVTRFCRSHHGFTALIRKQNSFAYIRDLRLGHTAIGIQSNALPLDQFLSLRRAARPCRLVRLGDAVANISIVKTAAEINCMRRAAAIGSSALRQWLGFLRPGVTEFAAARRLEYLCAEAGSEKASFDTIVLFGRRSSLPHGVPSGARLKRGDWVLIDFGCTVKGFCSDMTRTFVFGKASRRQREIYAVVAEAREQACRALRAGVPASAPDVAARAVIDAAGYRAQFGHATGHGVGMRVHENPRLFRDERFILPENAVVTIEPGVYCSGFGGCRIEDMVVTTRTGGSLITEFPRDFVEL
ncbi:MAG: Xaa-Pro peptidase family protein [Chitinivibrionales bacterium]|nr:Xaa-Pro peptidase family protein [Chitinivibrionales bacterium]